MRVALFILGISIGVAFCRALTYRVYWHHWTICDKCKYKEEWMMMSHPKTKKEKLSPVRDNFKNQRFGGLGGHGIVYPGPGAPPPSFLLRSGCGGGWGIGLVGFCLFISIYTSSFEVKLVLKNILHSFSDFFDMYLISGRKVPEKNCETKPEYKVSYFLIKIRMLSSGKFCT